MPTIDENTRINNEIASSQYSNIISYSNDEFEIANRGTSDFFDIINFIKNTLDTDKRINVTEDITAYDKDFSDKVDISCCTFKQKFKLIKCRFEKSFTAKHVVFENETSFKKSSFKGKTRFHHSQFKESTEFENTTFNTLIDFYEAEFEKPQKFFLTDFLDVTIFSNVTFHNQIQFVYNKVKSESIISFENATCLNSIDISRSNFWCKLQFWGIKIPKIIPENIWLYETDNVSETTSQNWDIAYQRLRESYRIIKHTFRQEGNNIEGHKFHQKELFIFKKENSFFDIKKTVQWILKFRKWINQKNQRIETYITVWFNYVSNNFGQSWLRGIIFTLLTTLIFFSIFLKLSETKLYFNWNSDSVIETTKYFLQFLNVAKWDYSPFGIDIQEKYHLGYLILFIGRIFIGYGYYQTIQAFRKFGKN